MQTPVSPEVPDRLPEQFGRYQILSKLGQGGMGSVYLARDTQLDRRVALKVPHFTAEDGPEVLQRFHREARAAAMLHHPNLCPVYDVGQINGIHYLTMAYIEGEPLGKVLSAGGRLPLRQAAALVHRLTLALQEAHSRGIIHRDLKPSNIMVTANREPVVMDFGLALRTSQGGTRLTQSGVIVGTPAYMAPEQVAGDVQTIGPACDIYSLGVILYELVTGRLPFEGPVAAILGQILHMEPEPPSKHRPDLDSQLGSICQRAMAKKVPDRFASMGHFAVALADYLETGERPAAEQVSAATTANEITRPSEGAATKPWGEGEETKRLRQRMFLRRLKRLKRLRAEASSCGLTFSMVCFGAICGFAVFGFLVSLLGKPSDFFLVFLIPILLASALLPEWLRYGMNARATEKAIHRILEEFPQEIQRWGGKAILEDAAVVGELIHLLEAESKGIAEKK
jgi:serine/threonine protein kinase